MVPRQMTLAVGFGASSSVSAQEVADAIGAALVAAGYGWADVWLIASHDRPHLRALAQEVGLGMGKEAAVFGELDAADSRLLTRDGAAASGFDGASLAEMAALRAIGAEGQLLGPRFVAGRVTVALARG